jgi:hypothetical protein
MDFESARASTTVTSSPKYAAPIERMVGLHRRLSFVFGPRFQPLDSRRKRFTTKQWVSIGICAMLLCGVLLAWVSEAASPPPPPPPPPPLECVKADIPVFAAASEFNTSQWESYITTLYGNESLPVLDVHSLTMLYVEIIMESGIQLRTAPDECLCRAEKGIVTHSGRGIPFAWDPPNTLWQWDYDRAALRNHSLTEVTHCTAAFKDDAHDRELYGAWFYRTRGSGIFLDIGRTRAFDSHEDAVRALLDDDLRCDDFYGGSAECVPYFYDLVGAARAAGLDSLQFLSHGDQRCGNMAIELLYLHGNGALSCANVTLRKFNGEVCTCDSTRRCATCN